MGCTMKRCKRCDVYVKDDTIQCPLCDSILEGGEQGKNSYPKFTDELHKFRFINRIFYFATLVLAVAAVMVNYYTFRYISIYWSVIVLGAIGYCWFTLSYTVMHRTNLGGKVIVQALGILVLTVIIDIVTGYRGWSLRFVIPGLLLLADVVLILLMAIQPHRWQGFFMCQLAVGVLALIPVIVAYFGLIDNMFLAILACVIVWLSLAGTIIFGGKRARLELKRRFHT